MSMGDVTRGREGLVVVAVTVATAAGIGGGCSLDLDALAGTGAAPPATTTDGSGGEGGARSTTTTTGGDGGGGAGAASGGGAGGGAGGSGGSAATLRLTTLATTCPDGRLFGGVGRQASDDVVMQLTCGATAGDCTGGTTLAGLGQGPTCEGEVLASHDGCPQTITVAPQEAWYFTGRASPPGLDAFMMPSFSSSAIALPGEEVRGMVGGNGGTLTYALGPIGGGGPTTVYFMENGNPTAVAGWGDHVIEILDGAFVVGEQISLGEVRLVQASNPSMSLAPIGSFELPGCATPRALRQGRRAFGGAWIFEPIVAVGCDIDGGTRVYVSTQPVADGQAFPYVDLPPGVTPHALHFNLAGDTLWVWDPTSGTLLELDADAPSLRHRWSLPAAYAGSAMVRLPGREELILGGPAPGQLTLAAPATASTRCAAGAQTTIAPDGP